MPQPGACRWSRFTLRERGFKIKDDEVKDQTDFIHAFLKTNKEKFVKGQGTGGQVDTAGYALLTLELGGRKPDDVTAAVAEYLLKYQPDRDHWRAVSSRPPSEASHFTTTYLALRGLRAWGTKEQKEAIAKRVEATRGWLLRTPAMDTEDRVFRLLAMKEAGIEENVIRAAANSLRIMQRPDGGWSQIEGNASDAYATGAPVRAQDGRGARLQGRRIPARPRLPAANATSGRLVVSQVTQQAVSALLRKRLPTREGPVYLRSRQRLGNRSAGGGGDEVKGKWGHLRGASTVNLSPQASLR